MSTGSGTVHSPLASDPAEYRREVHATSAHAGAAVFEGFTDDELDRCTARSNIIRCAAGDRVLKKGGAARSVFVVLSGALEVSDEGRPIAVLLPGDVVGETAFLLERRRTRDVDVLSDQTRILCLNEPCLRALTVNDPVVAAKLLGNLSKNLVPASCRPAPLLEVCCVLSE